jgi:hypothetical protein
MMGYICGNTKGEGFEKERKRLFDMLNPSISFGPLFEHWEM